MRPSPWHRREDRRACADGDARLAAGEPLPLVAALRFRQRRMQERDPLAEPRAEAAHRLRRERDLRHEDDRSEPALEDRRARLEIHLGLAAARCAVQEEVRAGAVVERAHDACDGIDLGGRESQRRRLAVERVAQSRLRSLAARLPLHRSNERESARRRRAVVVRDPQRQLDEPPGQLLDDALDRSDDDAVRRLDPDLDHEPATLRVSEPHLDDRADARLLGHLVREGPRERSRGDEWVDGGEPGHRPRLLRGCRGLRRRWRRG